MIGNQTFVTALTLYALLLGTVGATDSIKPKLDLAGHVAYLQSGDVWVADVSGKNRQKITNSGKVQNFLFSPNSAHLALTIDKTESGQPLTIIYDMKSGQVVKELVSDRSDYFGIEYWVSVGKLRIIRMDSVDGGGAGPEYDYELSTDNLSELDNLKPHNHLYRMTKEGGEVGIFVTNSGMGATYRYHLHLVEAGKKDSEIIATNRSILAPSISATGGYIAFVSVMSHVDEPNKRDQYWIYDRQSKKLREFFQTPVYAKPGLPDVDLRWSPNDRYILTPWSKDYLSATVVEVGNPSKTLIIAANRFPNVSFVDDENVVVEREKGIYLQKIGGNTNLIIDGAKSPVFLVKPRRQSPSELIHHSDRGVPYASEEYRFISCS